MSGRLEGRVLTRDDDSSDSSSPMHLLLLLVGLASTSTGLMVPLINAGAEVGSQVCPREDYELVTKEDAVAQLAEGLPLVAKCVLGDLDFGQARVIGNDIVVIDSVIAGGILAPASRFSGSLNLRGTEVDGDVLLENALFEDDVILQGASFRSRVSASRAQFRRHLSLSTATFHDDADFSQTLFLGMVDARTTSFDGAASFQEASFSQRSSFTLATFRGPSSFETAMFADDADFTGATLQPTVMAAEGIGQCARFSIRGASTESSISLRLADIGVHIQADSITAGLLDFESAQFRPHVRIYLNRPTIRELRLDVESVYRIVALPDERWSEEDDNPLSCKSARFEGQARQNDRIGALMTIERGASESRDLESATLAEFKRMQLENEQRSQPMRAIAAVFYENALGYFIRPIRPLIVLLFWLAFTFGSQLYLRQPPVTGSVARRAWDYTKQSTWKLPWRHSPSVDEFRGEGWRRRASVIISWFQSAVSSALLVAIVVGATRTIPLTKEILNAL